MIAQWKRSDDGVISRLDLVDIETAVNRIPLKAAVISGAFFGLSPKFAVMRIFTRLPHGNRCYIKVTDADWKLLEIQSIEGDVDFLEEVLRNLGYVSADDPTE